LLALTRAIEPPPAPMVRISIIGRRTGNRVDLAQGDDLEPGVANHGYVEAGAAHTTATRLGSSSRRASSSAAIRATARAR